MGKMFSKEELAVFRECNREAFLQRSIPLGTVMGVGTWLAIRRGLLKPSRSTLKIVSATIVGLFIGRISYQSQCAEKIMRLPNSRLAEALKHKRNGEFFESFTPFGWGPLAPFSSTADVYTDENLKAPTQRTGTQP